MAFSVAFNLVSKFVSCPVVVTDIAGARFILTTPDAGGKVSDVMILIS